MRQGIFIISIIFIVAGSSCLFCNNLVSNPGLEEGTSKIPDKWATHIYVKDEGTTAVEWLAAGGYHGNRAVFINNINGNDSRFTQIIPIKESGKYRFSCWLKTEDIKSEGSAGAGISLFNQFDIVTLSDSHYDWQQLTMYVDIANGFPEVKIAFGIGGFGSICKGKAWFDEIVFEKVDSFPEGANIAYIKKDPFQIDKVDFRILFVFGINVSLIIMALIITGLYLNKKRPPA